MKKLFSLILAALLLAAAIPAHAVAFSDADSVIVIGGGDNSINASHQIASYSITISPRGSGRVDVTVNVIGTHRQMTRIGFPSVAIYERNNSSSPWRIVHTVGSLWNPTVPAGSHSQVVTFHGVAGRQYYAHSTFFAQDAQGSDTRAASSSIATAT
jgi:hypothetical protein